MASAAVRLLGGASLVAPWRPRTTSTGTARRWRPPSAGRDARATSGGWCSTAGRRSPRSPPTSATSRTSGVQAARPAAGSSCGRTTPAPGTLPRSEHRDDTDRRPVGLPRPGGRSTAAPRDERDRVVLMPVHGIQTQRVRGDHAHWRTAGATPRAPPPPASTRLTPPTPRSSAPTAAPAIACVVLGERLEADFLWRLWTMLGRAERVVSNRLSTPVLLRGPPRRRRRGLRGRPAPRRRVGGAERPGARSCGPSCTPSTWRPASGRDHRRRRARVCPRCAAPAELEQLLGWDGARASSGGRVLDDVGRAAHVVNLQRKAAAPAAPAAPPGDEDSRGSPSSSWLRAATTYLPRPLPRGITPAGGPVEPLEVPGDA